VVDAGFGPEEAKEFIQDLADDYANLPFSATIFDLFGIAP
jgi:hypothetical protein